VDDGAVAAMTAVAAATMVAAVGEAVT